MPQRIKHGCRRRRCCGKRLTQAACGRGSSKPGSNSRSTIMATPFGIQSAASSRARAMTAVSPRSWMPTSASLSDGPARRFTPACIRFTARNSARPIWKISLWSPASRRRRRRACSICGSSRRSAARRRCASANSPRRRNFWSAMSRTCSSIRPSAGRSCRRKIYRVVDRIGRRARSARALNGRRHRSSLFAPPCSTATRPAPGPAIRCCAIRRADPDPRL